MNCLSGRVSVAIYQKEKKGNIDCGDSYFLQETNTGLICAIADGLGSGKYAKESSQLVIDIMKQTPSLAGDTLVKICNEKLAGKRGVVLGVFRIDYDKQEYSFSSIGNIGLMTVDQNKKRNRNIPKRGYLANSFCQLKTIRTKIESNMNFFVFSDGVSDVELSQKYFLNNDVQDVIDTFSYTGVHDRIDDTTLIGIRYHL